MDPLLRPEFLLLLLEQGERSLEDHTGLFLLLANATGYPDDALCAFYDASLNTACRALSSDDGPREDFAAFVEWTLARNGSPLTVCPEDDLARSTPDPEPSPPSPRGKEHQPEPTDDGEPFPAAICEPALSRATERMIVPEVEPNPSDQVREPATVPITREQAVDGVSAEWSSAPCTAAEGELLIDLGLLDMERDLIDWDTALEIELPPLLSPSSSTWVLSRSGSAADLRSSAFALVARALGSTLAPRILGIPLARWLSVSASGSSTTCSATVGRPPGVGGHHSSMATPSVGSTVDHHGCGLGPAVRLLLRVPPVSSLAPCDPV